MLTSIPGRGIESSARGRALNTEPASFFFNEINRARPQVHSLMLRAMAERSVSAFNAEHRFPHLQVFADRNRVEREETFEIPAAVRDRFFMEITISMPDDPDLLRALMADTRYHDVAALVEEMDPDVVPFRDLNEAASHIQSSVGASETLLRYTLDLCLATRNPAGFGIALDGVDVQRLVQAGASPRGMSMLLRAARVAAWLAGRSEVVPEDLHTVFGPVVAHRIFFTPIYEMRRPEDAFAFIGCDERVREEFVLPPTRDPARFSTSPPACAHSLRAGADRRVCWRRCR